MRVPSAKRSTGPNEAQSLTRYSVISSWILGTLSRRQSIITAPQTARTERHSYRYIRVCHGGIYQVSALCLTINGQDNNMASVTGSATVTCTPHFKNDAERPWITQEGVGIISISLHPKSEITLEEVAKLIENLLLVKLQIR